MNKAKVLMIQTGGTVGQERGKDGVFRPSDKDYLDKVPGIYELADITVKRTVNIDSTNMDTSHRAMIAELIYKNHLKYEGFVIVHGTDTMVDSAAALNYMTQNLGRPIILTGSQKSIFEHGSDAPNNLYYAVKAATMDLGEVAIAFGDKIVRGNRAIKESEHGLNAFSSPRIPPIGEIGIDVMLANHRIKAYNGDPVLFTGFDTNIEFYQQSSGTSTKIFESYTTNEHIHGIVIGAYGAGNVQDRLVEHIATATKNGKPVLVVTNCQLGAADMGIYAVGSAPLEAGAISAGDMTMETATQKLMYAIGRANDAGYEGEDRLQFITTLIHRNYAGDISAQGNRFDYMRVKEARQRFELNSDLFHPMLDPREDETPKEDKKKE
ncbi:asparaginase [Thermoproteota archaeon]